MPDPLVPSATPGTRGQPYALNGQIVVEQRRADGNVDYLALGQAPPGTRDYTPVDVLGAALGSVSGAALPTGHIPGDAFNTAGNLYVAADNTSFSSLSRDQQDAFVSQFGSGNAAVVWAQVRNQQLLSQGQAISTPHGVVSYENARFAVQKAGYNGPTDSTSIATAYGMLVTPAPAVPPSPASHAAASAAISRSLELDSLSSIPRPLVLAGLALVVYEMFVKRGHR